MSAHHVLPTNTLPIPKNAPDIGECIYCGATDKPLDREHAIPYGLNGPWTLLRATCRDCADITHRFERDVLRSMLSAVRAVFAMQTRRKHERPAHLPLVFETAGVQSVVHVPLGEFPLYLPCLRLAPPTLAFGQPAADTLPMELGLMHVAGPTFEDVSARQPAGVEFVGTRLSFAPTLFMRTVAKMAYCAAVYVVGVAPFRNLAIRDAILGKEPRIGHWVGSWSGERVNKNCGLHGMTVMSTGADVQVVVGLFAQFGAPEYHVALGPAEARFVESRSWRWK
jgi:hypothetical protein